MVGLQRPCFKMQMPQSHAVLLSCNTHRKYAFIVHIVSRLLHEL